MCLAVSCFHLFKLLSRALLTAISLLMILTFTLDTVVLKNERLFRINCLMNACCSMSPLSIHRVEKHQQWSTPSSPALSVTSSICWGQDIVLCWRSGWGDTETPSYNTCRTSLKLIHKPLSMLRQSVCQSQEVQCTIWDKTIFTDQRRTAVR